LDGEDVVHVEDIANAPDLHVTPGLRLRPAAQNEVANRPAIKGAPWRDLPGTFDRDIRDAFARPNVSSACT